MSKKRKSSTIFIDEAGNTGDDLVKGNQPFFTIAALGIARRATESIRTDVHALRTRYRLDPTQELKAARLLGTRNESILLDIFYLLLDTKSHPFFTVVEKRFMIAGRIIEDLLDPVYNDKTDNRWTHPSQTKIDLANFFYDSLSDQTIALSGNAFQRGELTSVSKAYDSIIADLRGKRFQFDVIALLSGAAPHLEALSKDKLRAEQIFKSAFGAQTGVLNSPNLTTYFELLHRLEGFYRLMDHGSAALVFDSARQFNAAFAKLHESMSKAQSNVLRLPGMTPLLFGFTNLVSFEDSESRSNIFLQLADLLASSINLLFVKIDESEETTVFTEFELFIIALVYQLLDDGFGDWLTSRRLKLKFVKVFIDEGMKLQGRHSNS